jgi:hypothetical protein
MKFARFPKFALLFAIAAALTLTLAGCGAAVSNLAITPGNWAVAATSTAPVKVSGAASITFVLGGNLAQSGTNLTGTMYVSQSVCMAPQTVAVTGTVKGTDVTLTSASLDGNVIAVTASGTKDAWTGTYTVTGDCADSGTVTAGPVPSISGTWAGTLANPPSGKVGLGVAQPTVSIALTQAPAASEDGTFALAGDITYSNFSCSATGTIANASLAGNYIGSMTAITDDGNGAASFEGVVLDSITAPQNMSGTYTVTFSDFCSNEPQSFTLTKQ